MKQLFLHGGPLESETFSGKTFWVHKDQAFRALEYADEGELWGVLIDPTDESFAAHDGPFGDRGTIISRHRSQELAERAATRRDPSGGWLKIENAKERQK